MNHLHKIYYHSTDLLLLRTHLVLEHSQHLVQHRVEIVSELLHHPRLVLMIHRHQRKYHLLDPQVKLLQIRTMQHNQPVIISPTYHILTLQSVTVSDVQNLFEFSLILHSIKKVLLNLVVIYSHPQR